MRQQELIIYREVEERELLSITYHKRSANQNHIEVSFHTGKIGHDYNVYYVIAGEAFLCLLVICVSSFVFLSSICS